MNYWAMRKLIFFAFLLLVKPATLCSQQALPFIEWYDSKVTKYFPQTWVTESSPSGELVVGHGLGISMFNGSRWWNPAFNDRMIDVGRKSLGGSVHGVVYDSLRDVFWIGGSSIFGRLEKSSSENSSVWEYFDKNELLPDSLADFGEIYFMASHKGNIFFASSKFLFWITPENVIGVHSFVSKLLPSGNELFLFDRANNITRWNGERFESFAGISESIGFMGEIDGSHQVVLRDGRILRLEGNSVKSTRFLHPENKPLGFVYCGLVLQDGGFALATVNDGLYVFDAKGENMLHLHEQNGLKSSMILHLRQDRFGSVWAATGKGVHRIDVTVPIRKFGKSEGFPAVFSVAERQGNYFLAAESGLMILDENLALKSQINSFSGVSKPMVALRNAVVMNWVTVGLVAFDEGGDELARFFEQGQCFALHKIPTSDHEFLAGFSNVVLHLKFNGQAFSVLKRWPLKGVARSVFLDSKERIWIDNANKQIQWSQFSNPKKDTSLWRTVAYPQTNRLKNSDFVEIGQKITIGTTEGIFVWNEKNSSFERPDPDFPLSSFPQNHFSQFARSSDKIWMVNSLSIESVLTTAAQEPPKNGFFALVQPEQTEQLFVDSKKRVWMVNGEGAIVADSTVLEVPEWKFSAHIGAVLTLEDSLLFDRTIFSPFSKTMFSLPFEEASLKFEVSVPFYIGSDQILYQFRLNGLDQNWSAWTNRASKEFTFIREGNYEFQVRAKNAFGQLSEIDGVRFSVLPPWYRTFWAYALYAILVMGFFYVIYRIRLAQILKVERLRLSLAGDLHDEVSATLSSISFFAQAIDSEGEQEKRQRFVNLISESAGDAKGKISDIIWAINPENDNWSSFLLKMQRFAQDTLTSLRISFDIDIVDDIPGELNMHVRQQLWMMFKEMLTNAARHSQASHITVHLSYANNMLRLIVADDGIGMPQSEDSIGNGLKNIRRRADNIGAKVTLHSAVGSGTRWELEIKL